MIKLDHYQYFEKDILGKGSFGKVYKGTDVRNNEKVAIKIMDMTLFDEEFLIDSLKNEIGIMKQLQHPNIVRLLDVFGDNNQTVIVLELCEGGDLRNFIQKHGGKLDENLAQAVLIQLMNGFQEMISHGFIHRDIKPENALIKDGQHKVADFGFATKADITGRQLLKECVGTPLYMSPQLLERKHYTAKCDIWSIGLMAYEMIYGRQPWPCRDCNSYLRNIQNQPLKFPFDKQISEQFKDFIKKCLTIDETLRIGWQEVFNHPMLHVNDTQRDFQHDEIDKQSRKILAAIQRIVQARGLNVNEQFLQYDHDQGGSLDQNEFYQFLHFLDPTLTIQENQHLFYLLDRNQDGQISLDEFKHIFCDIDFSDLDDIAGRIITDLKEIIKANNLNLEDIFVNFDDDKQGDLSIDEFSKLIKVIAPAIKEHEIQQIFQKFDKNNDKSISFEEFKRELAFGIDEFDPQKEKALKLINELRKLSKEHNLEPQLIFKNFDKNNDQYLDFQEFQKICEVLDKGMTLEERQVTFQMVDFKQSQRIGLDDFLSIFK